VLSSNHGSEWLIWSFRPVLADHLIQGVFAWIVTPGRKGEFFTNCMTVGPICSGLPSAD
jgi:hypothetical protein